MLFLWNKVLKVKLLVESNMYYKTTFYYGKFQTYGKPERIV